MITSISLHTEVGLAFNQSKLTIKWKKSVPFADEFKLLKAYISVNRDVFLSAFFDSKDSTFNVNHDFSSLLKFLANELLIEVWIYDSVANKVLDAKQITYEQKTFSFIIKKQMSPSYLKLEEFENKKRIVSIKGPYKNGKSVSNFTPLSITPVFRAYFNKGIYIDNTKSVNWAYTYYNRDGKKIRIEGNSSKIIRTGEKDKFALKSARVNYFSTFCEMNCNFHNHSDIYKIRVYAYINSPSEKVSVSFTTIDKNRIISEFQNKFRSHISKLYSGNKVLKESGHCLCYRDLKIEDFNKILKELRESEELTTPNLLFTKKNSKLPKEDKKISKFVKELNLVFDKYNIENCLRKIHFIAQVYHETDRFKTTREYGKSKKSYDPWRGRGLMQLTHKTAYSSYKDYSDEDVVSKYERVANELQLAIDSAGWFWQKGKAELINKGKKWRVPKNKYTTYDESVGKVYKKIDFNLLADDDHIDTISWLVNGGGNGRMERRKYQEVLKKAFHFPNNCQFVNSNKSNIANNNNNNDDVKPSFLGAWTEKTTSKNGNEEEVLRIGLEKGISSLFKGFASSYLSKEPVVLYEQKTNKHGMVELPHDTDSLNGEFTLKSMTLYKFHNRNDEFPGGVKEKDQWGTPENMARFINLAIGYTIKFEGELLSFGDLSTETGGSPRYFSKKKGKHVPHASHFKGSQVDLRYPTAKGNASDIKLADIPRTKWLLEKAKELGMNLRIVGSNPPEELNGYYTSTRSDHYNHIHLGVKT